MATKQAALFAFVGCLVLGLFALASFCNGQNPHYLATADVPEGFCAVTWASGLRRPRAIRFASNGDAIVIESDESRIQGLNHGLVIDEKNGYIYASTSREVWRWHYSPGQRSNLGTAAKVIYGIPCCGHLTRTLEMDDEGNLYVSVGSLKNVDMDDKSAMIRRFINPAAYTTSHQWDDGEIWARGMRNEVGIRFDYSNPRRLWGVENGVDNVQRVDMGDVHNDNPSEEVNIFDKPGAFYGYPSEYNLKGSRLGPNVRPGHTRGTQWLHPTFIRDTRFRWAHTAPMDIVFYNGTGFPASWRGDAFISLHGSWNRPSPVGYNVVRLVMNKTTGLPEEELPFFSPKEGGSSKNKRHDGHESDEGEDPYPPVPGSWDIRPVSLDFGPCGASNECLFLTSDKNGLIVAVAYNGVAGEAKR
ncbi:Lsorbosone dehydrogenase [Acanthamoeba castellanii str. Neff]|uniref:Lsorbosone dehydrogenase n=1 Tax=Acanthamoeba castellanii (strain ATCC 30010 / Neff) TaxID=1257118 RepID=L8H6K6_ACACF|nr:Lsorbosone dehydrogenase [Acanthamoeba castellanii str. Neff]ELR20785.1 Lsorbosone dehydrogenase [Acanthamoeba castellanii str. Neff]